MPPTKVFSLLCHAHMDMALQCLGSFVAHCQSPIDLFVVSDGSLTEQDKDSLYASLPDVTILNPSDFEPVVLPALENAPLSREYREWCAWAIKLLDIPIYAKSDFVYLDSDILFLRNFTGFDSLSKLGAGIVSMRSVGNVYSFSLADILSRTPRLPLINRLNAGFLWVRENAFDLDLTERFIQESQGNKKDDRTSLWEQTAWACMAAQVRSAHFNRRQVTFPQNVFNSQHQLRWKPVAIHFVGGTRHLLADAVAMQKFDDAPVDLRFEKTTRLNPTSHIVDICKHRLLANRCRRAGLLE